jgi:hypothetical protein
MSGAAVYAQKITPTVLSSAGAVMKNNNNSIEWTLGEIATETIKSNNNSISQGFHQTNLTIVSTNNPGITGLQIYPNPVQDDLIIENQSGKSVTIHVITMNGQCITEEKFEPGTQNLKMNSMPAGSYIIEALSGSQKHNLVIEKIK